MVCLTVEDEEKTVDSDESSDSDFEGVPPDDTADSGCEEGETFQEMTFLRKHRMKIKDVVEVRYCNNGNWNTIREGEPLCDEDPSSYHKPLYLSLLDYELQIFIHYLPRPHSKILTEFKLCWSMETLYRWGLLDFDHSSDRFFTLFIKFVRPPTIKTRRRTRHKRGKRKKPDVAFQRMEPEVPMLQELLKSAKISITFDKAKTEKCLIQSIMQYNKYVHSSFKISERKFALLSEIYEVKEIVELKRHHEHTKKPYLSDHSCLTREIQKQMRAMCQGGQRQCSECHKYFYWFEPRHPICLPESASAPSIGNNIPSRIFDQDSSIRAELIKDPVELDEPASELLMSDPAVWTTLLLRFFCHCVVYMCQNKKQAVLTCCQDADWKYLFITAGFWMKILVSSTQEVIDEQKITAPDDLHVFYSSMLCVVAKMFYVCLSDIEELGADCPWWKTELRFRSHYKTDEIFDDIEYMRWLNFCFDEYVSFRDGAVLNFHETSPNVPSSNSDNHLKDD